MGALPEIAIRVRAARDAAGLSQAAAASFAGMSPSSYWRVEQGTSDLTVPQLVALAATFGVRPEDLIAGIAPPEDASLVGRLIALEREVAELRAERDG